MISGQTNFHDTNGELSVSNSGTANYTLSIATPPGIKSVAPQVSLNYSSSGNNGMAGYGWNISGVSSISRIQSRIDLDKNIDAVDFDSEDRFALDGQRFIIKTGTYGTAGATYQTENSSNLKIESFGTFSYAGITNPYGPAYFVVTFPDGTHAEYGNSTDSKGISEYLINKWIDSQGNYIQYTYTTDQNTKFISQIKWGSNTNVSTNYFNTINFYYKARTRAEYSYINGQKVATNKLLDRIEVSANGTLFRKYIITHENIAANYQRVKQIQEFNGVLEAANPVVFNYGKRDVVYR